MVSNAECIDAIAAAAADCASRISAISKKGTVSGLSYVVTAPRVPKAGTEPVADSRVVPPTPPEPDLPLEYQPMLQLALLLLHDVQHMQQSSFRPAGHPRQGQVQLIHSNLQQLQGQLQNLQPQPQQQHQWHQQQWQQWQQQLEKIHKELQRLRPEVREMQRHQQRWLRAISTPVFGVAEVPVVEPSSTVLARLEFSLPIEAIPDTFNDKLDYTCRSYADLVRLVEGMLPIVNKYKLFGDAPNVKGILQTFRANFDCILAGLETARLALQDNPPSRLADVRARLEEANAALRSAQALGAVFFRSDRVGPHSAPAPTPSCHFGCGTPQNMCAHRSTCACQRAQVSPGLSRCAACIRSADSED